MAKDIQELRDQSKRLRNVTITKHEDMKPYIFISYKSDDWEEALEDVAYTLHRKYGVRVYYDKAFESSNDNWTKLMRENITSPWCVAVLVFLTPKYLTSYATLLEILTSQTRAAQKVDVRKKVKPIVPIVCDDEVFNNHITNLRIAETNKDESKQKTGISKVEWDAFEVVIKDIMNNKVSPEETKSACGELQDVRETEDLKREKVIDVFECLEDIIIANVNKKKLSTFYKTLYETLVEESNKYVKAYKELQKKDIEGIVDESFIREDYENIPKTSCEEITVDEKENKNETITETIVINGTTETDKKTAVRVEVTEVEQECVGSETTIGKVRMLFEDGAKASEFRETRENMPRGGKGALDYAMAAILGGCNQITEKSPSYQINYYTYDVATQDDSKKKQNGKLGATWTWSSNCRKVLGIDGAGQIPKEINSYFSNLPETTTLGDIEQWFKEAKIEAFQTKKNEMVMFAVQQIIKFMENVR